MDKKTFIALEERNRFVGACRYVKTVFESCLKDSDTRDIYHYYKLFVGSV